MLPGAVEVWLTTADQEHLLDRQPDLELGDDVAGAQVSVDDRRELQRMEGFGASFTESAAVLLHDHLEAASALT